MAKLEFKYFTFKLVNKKTKVSARVIIQARDKVAAMRVLRKEEGYSEAEWEIDGVY